MTKMEWIEKLSNVIRTGKHIESALSAIKALARNDKIYSNAIARTRYLNRLVYNHISKKDIESVLDKELKQGDRISIDYKFVTRDLWKHANDFGRIEGYYSKQPLNTMLGYCWVNLNNFDYMVYKTVVRKEND